MAWIGCKRRKKKKNGNQVLNSYSKSHYLPLSTSLFMQLFYRLFVYTLLLAYNNNLISDFYEWTASFVSYRGLVIFMSKIIGPLVHNFVHKSLQMQLFKHSKNSDIALHWQIYSKNFSYVFTTIDLYILYKKLIEKLTLIENFMYNKLTLM